jgi:tetratricopeptide (TPR) repeat protein
VLCGYANLLVERKPIRGWAKRAEELYQLALTVDPDHIQSRISLALLLKRQKRFSEADEHFRAVMDKDNQEYHARHAYAVFLKEVGNYDKAIEYLEKAFDPRVERYKTRLHNAMVHNAYAEVLRKVRAPSDQVISHFELALSLEAIDRQSRFHLMLTHKAFAEYLCGNNKQAASNEFEHALQFEPDNSYIRNSYARCLESHGDYDKALEQYKRVLEKLPNEIHALGGIAKLLGRQGHFKDAQEYYEQALGVDQNNIHILFPYGSTIISKLEQNDSYINDEELLKRASEIIDQLEKLAPTDQNVKNLSFRLSSILRRQ